MLDRSQVCDMACPTDGAADLSRLHPARRLRLPALGLILLLVVAACGSASPSNGVATLESPGATASASASGPASSQDPYQAMLAYAQCMRTHGIAAFPDPVNNGNGQVGMMIRGGPGSGLDPNSSQFQAAQQACQSLMPAAKGGNNGPADQKMRDEALAYSACMRSHGVANFPDPQFSSGGMTMKMPSGIDPNSAQFKAAQQACQSELPGFAGGGGATSGGPAGVTGGSAGTATQP